MKTKNKLILGFAGKICSGKGISADYIIKNSDANVVLFSQPLRDMLKRIYISTTRENMQLMSKIIREGFGQDILSKTIVGDIEEAKGKIVIVDGIRRLSDIALLETLPGFKMIYIEAPAKIRHERLKKRGQNPGDKAVSWPKFQTQDSAEAEHTIEELKKKADYVVVNDSTKQSLYKKIDEIIKNTRS